MSRVGRVLAPNPGPMTLDGTNTWVLRGGGPAGGPGEEQESDARRTVVVDPGPLLEGHLAAVRALAGEVALVLLTHRHADHSEGAAAFAASVGCRVRAVDPAHAAGVDLLHDGEHIEVDGLELQILCTPGHTSDSVSILRLDDGDLLTGDTVLGRGTSVVAHPDGQLGAYLKSLQRLRDLAARGVVTRLLPGHGPVVDDALAVLDGYLEHRYERLEQVRGALQAGARTPREVVESVYAGVDRSVWPAAELSVAAQLEHIRAGG
jgi:glyoxylase-like metal-dependent hydrolase (beta-lactamase superfamily II)